MMAERAAAAGMACAAAAQDDEAGNNGHFDDLKEMSHPWKYSMVFFQTSAMLLWVASGMYT